jgi:hypothetical protein
VVTEAAGLARLAAARARLDALGHVTVVARGYATVDLDAAAGASATIAGDSLRSAPDDTLLGARCRIVVTVDGPWIVLLEPVTEGRLAASLARHGQGPVVEYLALTVPRGETTVAAAARAAIALSPPAGGPFGPERLVLGDPASGPHLILLDEPPAGAPGPPPATIER